MAALVAETSSSLTMGEHIKLRKPKTQTNKTHRPISPQPDPTRETPLISQSTRPKTTISSFFKRTTSTTTAAATSFMGLGCTSSQKVSVPSIIRASADWDLKNDRNKKQKRKNQRKKKSGYTELRSGRSESKGIDGGGCVGCGPGIGLSTDCVVSAPRRNLQARIKTGNGDRTNFNHREPQHQGPSFFPRSTVSQDNFEFSDSDSDFVSSTRAEPEVFSSRYTRHHRHPSPDGFAEIMMLHNRLIMGGRLDSQDRFRALRLDVDNMTYEQLLELGERIGYVSTGLKEDEITRCLGKIKHSILNSHPSPVSTLVDNKCIICQEEYEVEDEMGNLSCGHGFHIDCIKQWLLHKNTCPVCKSAAAVSRR